MRKILLLLLISIFLTFCNEGEESSFVTKAYPNGIVYAQSKIYVAIGARHDGPNSTPVAAGTQSVVQVFDSSGALIKEIAVAGGGHAMRLTPDGSKIYLAHFSYDHLVTAISTSTDSVIGLIGGASQTTILAPDALSISPDGQYVYVGNNGPAGTGYIKRIFTSTNTIDPSWNANVAGGYICWVEVNPGNSNVYANSWTGGKIQKKIISTGADLTEVSVGDFPHAMTFDSTGTIIYALVTGGNKVLKLNAGDLSLISDLTGPWAGLWGGPASGTLSHSGDYLFIANHGLATIAVLDVNPSSASYDTVLQTFKVGSDPIFSVLSTDGKELYVANNGDSSITKIDVSAYP